MADARVQLPLSAQGASAPKQTGWCSQNRAPLRLKPNHNNQERHLNMVTKAKKKKAPPAFSPIEIMDREEDQIHAFATSNQKEAYRKAHWNATPEWLKKHLRAKREGIVVDDRIYLKCHNAGMKAARAAGFRLDDSPAAWAYAAKKNGR
jgi:hypothetical protein